MGISIIDCHINALSSGLTVADLVMPWFMFAMGVSFTYSMNSMFRRGFTKRDIYTKICIRSVKLLILGLWVVHSNLSWDTFRVPGVLQRFFICFLVVGGLHTFFQPVVRIPDHDDRFIDILPYWPQWIVILSLEMLWIFLTYFLRYKLPSDNSQCPQGYIGPGGLHENSKYWNCTGGAAGYIDNKVFGEKHIFQHVTSREVYFHDEYYFGGYIRHHDPCGILGSINSIVVVFLGLQAGKILQCYPDNESRAVRMAIWGGGLTLLGGALTGIQQYDGAMPINKNLWTLSFALVTSGWAFFLLLFLYYVVDVWMVWKGAPFYFVGMNSILIYLLHEILAGQIPFCGDACAGLDSHAKNMASQIGAVTIWSCYSCFLYINKFFVTL